MTSKLTTADIDAIRDHKALLLDVRSEQEYRDETCPFATNLNVHNIASGQMPDVSKHTPIFVYCRSGSRAELAKHTLEHKGFGSVTNIGGYKDLPPELTK